MKYLAVAAMALLISGCGVIQPTPSQEEAINTLQSELQTLIQENQAIQAGTAVYNENMAKIQTIQEEIQYYQDQIKKVQQQVQDAQDQANAIKDSADQYTEQWKGRLRTLGEKLQSIK